MIASLNTRKQAGHISFDRMIIDTADWANPDPILITILVDPYILQTLQVAEPAVRKIWDHHTQK